MEREELRKLIANLKDADIETIRRALWEFYDLKFCTEKKVTYNLKDFDWAFHKDKNPAGVPVTPLRYERNPGLLGDQITCSS